MGYGFFVLSTIGTMLLYTNAVVLAPKNLEEITDWKAHYYQNNRFVFLVLIAMNFWAVALQLMASLPLPDYSLTASVILALMFLVLALSGNEKFHVGGLFLTGGSAVAVLVLLQLI